jgi:serine/threonine protein kinase
MEYVSGGTLMPEEQECDPISEESAWKFFRQLLDALHYCSSSLDAFSSIPPSISNVHACNWCYDDCD